MKIDLTKEEWEFLRKSLNASVAFFLEEFSESEVEKSQSFQVLRKLGKEWIDDEEIREFHEEKYGKENSFQT